MIINNIQKKFANKYEGRKENIDKWPAKDYLVIDQNLKRPAEVDTLLADNSKAKKILGWEPEVSFDELVKSMVESDLEYVTNFKY